MPRQLPLDPDDLCDDPFCGSPATFTIVIERDQPIYPFASGINGRYCEEHAAEMLGMPSANR